MGQIGFIHGTSSMGQTHWIECVGGTERIHYMGQVAWDRHIGLSVLVGQTGVTTWVK